MHQTIGILGGMSPESTITYCEHITRTYTARFGDFAYPEILIHSVNFQSYVEWQKQGRWAEAARAMADCLERLRLAGADFGLIATNTMHIVFDEVQAAVGMPLISIVDATAEAIRAAGCRRVGLLGTQFTMQERFFRGGLERSGIDVLAPTPEDQVRIHSIIYDELCRGEVRSPSRAVFLESIDSLRAAGAEGVVLGCTEIPLLVKPADCDLPLFNTTIIHADAALSRALAKAGTMEAS